MKQIPLRTVEMHVRGHDKPIPLGYAESLLIVLEQPPRDGFSPAEMRARLPIGDRIERAVSEGADHVLLEDAQHKKLADLLKEHRFAIAHYAIIEMVDAVEGAPSVEVEAKKEP